MYDSSAFARCSELRSSYGNTATVASSSSYAARKARIAISPRLATSSLRNTGPPGYGRAHGDPGGADGRTAERGRGDRRRESHVPPCQGNRNVAHPFGPGAIVCCSVPRTYEIPSG